MRTTVLSEIKAMMIIDLMEMDWDTKAIAHIMGHGKATKKELKEALDKKANTRFGIGMPRSIKKVFSNILTAK